MNPAIDIILQTGCSENALAETVESLIAQTDRSFGVVVTDDATEATNNYLSAQLGRLETVGIAVRRVRAPFALGAIETLNWAHTQSKADWLKPLPAGVTLKPNYIVRLKERIRERPLAQFIRCDISRRTEWGVEKITTPFSQSFINANEAPHFFPARIDWLSYTANVAFSRTAWLACGGYSLQFPASTELNLNAILALHHGVENIHEPLVELSLENLSLNKSQGSRVNLSLELWAILRQAKNYCRAAKISWPDKCLIWQSFSAAWRRG